MLSKCTLKRYATGVLAISNASADYVAAIIDRAVAEGLGVAEVREIAIEAIMASTDTYGDMCRELACQLYEAETGKEAAFLASSEVDREAVTERVHYHAGKLADGNTEGFLKACKAEAYSLAKRNVNQSVIDSCYRSRRRRRKGGYTGGVRFARIPQGGETCTFCAMLASRGFVYWSRETAGEFNHYHAHCRCLIVPDDGSGKVEGYDPDEWYSRWKKLDELDGAGGLTDEQRRAAKALIARDASMSVEAAIDRATAEPVAASPVFLNSSSELYRRMQKVASLDGYYDVRSHSDGYSVIYGDLNDRDADPGTAMTIDELRETILADENYQGGPIRVVACGAGRFGNGLAQRLADAMGVEVLAPTSSVYVDFDGSLTLADTDEEYQGIVCGRLQEKGQWLTFRPGGQHEQPD